MKALLAQALIKAGLAAAPPGGLAAAGVGVGGIALPPPPPNATPASLAGVNPATRPYRRLYLGNLPAGARDTELHGFFNDVLTKVGQPGDHLVGVFVANDKPFGFAEFKTMEMATACLALDGVSCRGNPLKIKRPHDYKPELAPAPQGPPVSLDLAALGIVGSSVPDGPHKVFIGGLPYHLTEDNVKELLQSFGKLKAMHLVKDAGSATSKGYCFAEWADPSVTDVAVNGLNGLQIGDKSVRVFVREGGSLAWVGAG